MKKRVVTVKQIQALDSLAIDRYGVPSLALMENAGRGVACEILKLLRRIKGATVSIFCGLGNNAGDGFVIARHLINAGVKVRIYLIGKRSQLKQDAAVNYSILKKCRYPIKEFHRLNNEIIRVLKSSDIVVDAIFGVGLNREINEPFRSTINAINQNAKKIVAVDTPSGLDGTSGNTYGVCIKANATITFSFIKKGFLKSQGPKHIGKVIVVDIGIPRKLKDRLK